MKNIDILAMNYKMTMKSYKYSYPVVFFIVLNSCLSQRELMTGNSILENDLSILDGTYKNIAVNNRIPQDEFSLYLLLFKNYKVWYKCER